MNADYGRDVQPYAFLSDLYSGWRDEAHGWAGTEVEGGAGEEGEGGGGGNLRCCVILLDGENHGRTVRQKYRYY